MRLSFFARTASTLLLASLAGVTGCKSKQPIEEPVKKGDPWAETNGPALIKLGPDDPKPDYGAAYANRDAFLSMAADQSIRWFQAPSSKVFFPFYNQSTTEVVATHEQAGASLMAFKEALTTATSEDDFRGKIDQLFDVWQSVGYDADRNVLFTGYFSPEFKGSRTQTDRFRFPLYKRPADLVTDPITGEPKGRRMPDGTL